jgi:hypothetical protein
MTSWPQQTPFLHGTMTKVSKSGGDGTFAGASGNDQDAPIPASRLTTISRPKSTQSGQHMGWRLEAR